MAELPIQTGDGHATANNGDCESAHAQNAIPVEMWQGHASGPQAGTGLLYLAIGRLVCGWGIMEAALEHRIATLRIAAGDVPGSGSRTRPTMARMLAELRAIVSMRDRRNAAALSAIAEMERDIQRIDRFRGLIVNGFIGARADGAGFSLRDPKNGVTVCEIGEVERAVIAIESLRQRFLAI